MQAPRTIWWLENMNAELTIWFTWHFHISSKYYSLFAMQLQLFQLHLTQQRPFSPSVPSEAGCLFAVAASVHVFTSGESL